MFSNNSEITSIFQCLVTHVYWISIHIFSTNLYLTYDNVCNSGKEKNWNYLPVIIGESTAWKMSKNGIFFLVRIFLYLDWIEENTDQKNSVFGHFLRGDPFGAMSVSLLQWRAEIGIFSTKFFKYLYKSKYWHNVCPWYLNTFYTICCMFLLLLVCAGDIELNPGPIKNNASCNFSLCQWNLNSIAANNFLKRSLLKAYNM